MARAVLKKSGKVFRKCATTPKTHIMKQIECVDGPGDATWRAKAAKQRARSLSRKLRQLCRIPLRYPRSDAFRQRLIGKEHKHFFTCFRHRQVPPTNSKAEQSMRPVVLMRHVVHCTRSVKGLENHGVLRSLFETARRQGTKVHQFFLELFTKDTASAQGALYRHPLPAPPASKKDAKKVGAKKSHHDYQLNYYSGPAPKANRDPAAIQFPAGRANCSTTVLSSANCRRNSSISASFCSSLRFKPWMADSSTPSYSSVVIDLSSRPG